MCCPRRQRPTGRARDLTHRPFGYWTTCCTYWATVAPQKKKKKKKSCAICKTNGEGVSSQAAVALRNSCSFAATSVWHANAVHVCVFWSGSYLPTGWEKKNDLVSRLFAALDFTNCVCDDLVSPTPLFSPLDIQNAPLQRPHRKVTFISPLFNSKTHHIGPPPPPRPLACSCYRKSMSSASTEIQQPWNESCLIPSRRSEFSPFCRRSAAGVNRSCQTRTKWWQTFDFLDNFFKMTTYAWTAKSRNICNIMTITK